MLAAGTAAAASSAASGIGLPVLVPTLQEEYVLSLAQIGVLLAAGWVGTLSTLLLWGLAADRWGERVAIGIGLLGCAASLAGAAFAPSYEALLVFLGLAGAMGASVNSASGRAVMVWFGPEERGLALGIRQTAIPLGAFIAAVVVPVLAQEGGSELAFLFLAALCVGGATTGILVLRGRDGREGIEPEAVPWTLRDRRLLRLCLGSGLYLYAQVAVIGFGVLFLHDEHGLSERAAALVFAAAQLLAMGLRIGAGWWSDALRSRLRPLLRVGLAIAVSVAVTAALARGPIWLLVPSLAVAGGLSMAWNGLSFTAAAELGGARRSGAAIGFQQTVLASVGVVAPIVFAASVSSLSWTAAFAVAAVVPVLGWLVLLPLRGH